MSLFEHVPHPHVALRKETGPVKVQDQLKRDNWYKRINAKVAIWVTVGVGSMTCAWLFAILAIAGLPTALKPGNIGFLFWFSSDLLQLTLLSVIIVGQNIQAQAADKRAEQTYQDAEAVLHEALQIQEHLIAQDAVLTQLVDRMDGKVGTLAADAKAARSAAESAFVAMQAIAAVMTAKPPAGSAGTAGPTPMKPVAPKGNKP